MDCLLDEGSQLFSFRGSCLSAYVQIMEHAREREENDEKEKFNMKVFRKCGMVLTGILCLAVMVSMLIPGGSVLGNEASGNAPVSAGAARPGTDGGNRL